MMENISGRELGRYRIISPFGEGGMAAVYKAYQPGTERYVALKILPRHYSQDSAFRERFQQEAQVIARFQHPHILPVFDYGEEDGYAYLAMPLIAGGSLAGRLHGEPLALGQVQDIISQIGEALDYAHDYGVIHRDVKPSNILIDERGNALLADFGIAKIVGDMANITGTGQTVGTPAYMSPEQIKGEELDGRSDVYSLGIVLYEMVTGRTPFRAETPPALYVKHLLDPLPLPSSLQPGVPEPVERVILKSLAKERDDRYDSAADMAAAIKDALDAGDQRTIPAHAVLPPGAAGNVEVTAMEETVQEGGGSAAEGPATEPSSTPGSKGRIILWAAAALVVVIGAAIIFRTVIERDSQPITEEDAPALAVSGAATEEPTGAPTAAAGSSPKVSEVNLISYWPFDEGSGDLAADTAAAGHENDGTLVAGAQWVPGQIGDALHFDPGREQHVKARNNGGSLSIPAGEITISAWIKPDSVDDERAILAKDKRLSSARGNYALFVHEGYLRFGFQPEPTGSDVWIDSLERIIEPDQWYFVALTFTFGGSEKPRLYVNGQETPPGEWQGSGDQANMPFTHEDPLLIGRTDANGNFFAGIIDEVKIYDRVLTPEEIAAEFKR